MHIQNDKKNAPHFFDDQSTNQTNRKTVSFLKELKIRVYLYIVKIFMYNLRISEKRNMAQNPG